MATRYTSKTAYLRVLYVASEIAPFLNTSSVAGFVRKLAPATQNKNVDIRILVPRFGLISERRNRLHEVVRLSGINIQVGQQAHPLSVKVTTIPGTRIQVYFIDNETYFQRKFVFKDEKGLFFADNDERLIFVCKGTLETVKNLNWVPDIVHCHDWITALIPFYLKKDPFFAATKVLFNLYNTAFEHLFIDDFLAKADLHGEADSFSSSGAVGFMELIYLGAKYADISIKSETFETTSLNSKLNNKKTIPHIATDEAGIDLYHKIYKQLIPSKSI
jgi:starch synthase